MGKITYGASLVFSTMILKVCSTGFAIFPSVKVSVTGFIPTLALVGVPLKTAEPSPLSVKVSQAGITDEPILRISPKSTSLVAIL